jgi:hypothetical protein
MVRRRQKIQDPTEADISIWKEALFGAELLLLHASPVYYGFGVPEGDGSGVVVIPGFLGNDDYLSDMHGWLSRIGYNSYLSGIRLNAECPNLLIQYRLARTIDTALQETGRKIHLVGHSLGGIIARSIAVQRRKDIASVIAIASPFAGAVVHQVVLRAANLVRNHILERHGDAVLPECYTTRCTCDFISSLRVKVPNSIKQTAIYTRDDGIADWRYCITGNPKNDVEVPGTHIGLAFNASVFKVVAERLAAAR